MEWQAAISDLPSPSFNDFDDAVRPRTNEDRSTIDDRIAVIGSSIFLGHVVVGHAVSRKVGADPHVALVGV